VATAVVGVPIVVALIWLGGFPLLMIAAIAAGVAGWEAINLLRRRTPTQEEMPALPRSERAAVGFCANSAWTLLAILGAAILVLGATFGPSVEIATLGAILIIALTLSLFLPNVQPRTADWPEALAASVYAGLPFALFVAMRQWPGDTGLEIVGIGRLGRGASWVLLTLTTVWAVDTAAYAVGRLVGRHPLWPRISPNKTWEGTGAGVLAGAVVCEAWAPLLQFDGLFALVLALALACSAIVGDLVESGLKRAAHVKDPGARLPGHGGLLDRIDSLVFSAIVVFLIGVVSKSAGINTFF